MATRRLGPLCRSGGSPRAHETAFKQPKPRAKNVRRYGRSGLVETRGEPAPIFLTRVVFLRTLNARLRTRPCGKSWTSWRLIGKADEPLGRVLQRLRKFLDENGTKIGTPQGVGAGGRVGRATRAGCLANQLLACRFSERTRSPADARNVSPWIPGSYAPYLDQSRTRPTGSSNPSSTDTAQSR